MDIHEAQAKGVDAVAAMTKEELMEKLYMTTANQLIKKLMSGDGTPSDFKNAIQMLKDNHIDCGEKSGPLEWIQSLHEQLPFDEELN